MSEKTRSDATNRNFGKFKLIGICNWLRRKSGGDGEQVTSGEAEKMAQASLLLEEVVESYESGSMELGFEDVGRRVGQRRGKGIKITW